MREQALLAQVHVLTEKHEALAAATGQNFNLFGILGRESDEVRTHSAIIAELLNPKGSHAQGPVFARRFAERFEIPTDGIESMRVWTEQTVDKGSRIDLLMEYGEMRVVVENKIYAGDQPRQLQRYHEYAAEWDRSKVIYLTLHGDEPSANSLGELSLDQVECRSYESDVLAWLDDCIKEVARVPQIREVLAHYEELLRKLTGKSKGELVMDIKELLENKQGDNTYNFELVPSVAAAMTEVSIESELKFWQSLKERLQDVGDRPWGLAALEADEARLIPIKEVSEEVVRHAHAGSRNTWEYGWTFRVDSGTDRERYRRDSVEVLLRVECEKPGWCGYGFIAVERTSDDMRRLLRGEDAYGLFDEWGKCLSGLEEGGWLTDFQSWLAWGYPSENIDLRKQKWLAPNVIRRFREEEAFAPLVEDIQSTIDALEGWNGDSSPDE